MQGSNSDPVGGSAKARSVEDSKVIAFWVGGFQHALSTRFYSIIVRKLLQPHVVCITTGIRTKTRSDSA